MYACDKDICLKIEHFCLAAHLWSNGLSCYSFCAPGKCGPVKVHVSKRDEMSPYY